MGGIGGSAGAIPTGTNAGVGGSAALTGGGGGGFVGSWGREGSLIVTNGGAGALASTTGGGGGGGFTCAFFWACMAAEIQTAIIAIETFFIIEVSTLDANHLRFHTISGKRLETSF